MSKSKKQMLTLLGLVALVILATAGYLAASKIQKSKDKNESVEETEQIPIYSLNEEEVAKIHVKSESLDATYVKEDGIWVDEADKEFPVDQEKVAEMVSQTASVSATKELDLGDRELKEFQLDNPQYQIELTDASGKIHSLLIGLESVAAEGFYASTDQNSKKVYVVSSTISEAMEYTRNQMMKLPDSPEITAEYVTAYEVTSTTHKPFCAVYQANQSEYKDYDGWDITKSIYKKTKPGDKESLLQLFAGLSSLTFSEGVTYKSTKSELKKYGLDKPAYTIDVSYYTVKGQEQEQNEQKQEIKEEDKEEHVFKLNVGNLSSDENNFYVQIDGEKGVYLMPLETIHGLVNIEPFAYVKKKVYNANINTVQSLEITKDGKKHIFDITKEEYEDAIPVDGVPVYKYFVKMDNKDVDGNTFKTTFENVFNSLVYSGERTKEVKGKSEIAIKVKTDDRTLNIEFLPYDGVNFYQAKVDGQNDFLVDINVVKNTVDKLLASK